MNAKHREPGVESRFGKLYERALEILLFVLIAPALLSSLAAVEWFPV